MKKITLFTLLLFITLSIFSQTKIKFENNIELSFEGCTDGSVRFEATFEKPNYTTREFELKREASPKPFSLDADGSFSWENYTVSPNENGYTLFYGKKALYTSTFSTEKTLLKELREWKNAEAFYGFGQASSNVNLSNQSLTIYNESKYGNHAFIFIPFYFTNENTSVYYNSNGKDKIYFQDGKDFQLYRTEYNRIECFVRQDLSAADCVKKFYQETETSCIMPKWAYGYIQSKYGYKSADEVIELSQEFQKRDIPLSAVVLDLYWFEKMGDIWWTSKDFANYEEMEAKLEENGTKLITITEPFYCSDSKNFSELKKKKLLCKTDKGKLCLWRDWWCFDSKDGGIFNPLGKKASEFMGDKYGKMLESGIDGFWTDLGEPEGAWNQKGLKYSKFDEVDFHNYYNYYWTKALYDGVHKNYPDKRLFIMSRSAYTGSGKFNVSVWSGDVSVSWPSLAKNIAWGINSSLSGLPYWGSDVGGFTPEKSPEELYIRWQQFGAFTPIYRAHGTGPREPYAYSEEAEKIVGDLIRNRNYLLPYIYSTARETMKGKPMMRAMNLEFDGVPSEFIESQYMFGSSILVSPITREARYESEHETYLPEGNWYDLYSFEKVSGGKVIKTKNTIEKIPVYLKEASIIPFSKDGIEGLFLLPSEKGKAEFTLYNDDGESEQYKNGNFSELLLTLENQDGKLFLKGEIKGNEKFLSEKYSLVLPEGSKTKKIEVSLNDILSGVEL